MSGPDGGLRLRLEGVAGERGGRRLFDRIDLDLGPGEAALVTGANGVGKSSLLRICAGLLAPAAGRVERAPCALADEQAALDANWTLGQALGFWARLDGREAQAGLDAFGLAALARVPVRMLSTGQRKRAVLARTMASGAPLWLLDEPSNGLDAEGLDRLVAAVAEHRTAGGAVVVASHQPIPIGSPKRVAL